MSKLFKDITADIHYSLNLYIYINKWLGFYGVRVSLRSKANILSNSVLNENDEVY